MRIHIGIQLIWLHLVRNTLNQERDIMNNNDLTGMLLVFTMSSVMTYMLLMGEAL